MFGALDGGRVSCLLAVLLSLGQDRVGIGVSHLELSTRDVILTDDTDAWMLEIPRRHIITPDESLADSPPPCVTRGLQDFDKVTNPSASHPHNHKQHVAHTNP
jgi:hypothetical protein